MATLVYKMTHKGDPDSELGFWGVEDCMGQVRGYGFDAVIGIGGMTAEPVSPGTLRMRRFYVASGFRRRGIARRLAQRLLARPETGGRLITVNAAPGSKPFWRSLGFIPDRREGHTHLLPARSTPGPGVNRDAGGGAAARHRPPIA